MQSSGVVVMESIDPADRLRNGTVTGKLLGLLVSGIPGIAVVSKESEITRLVLNVNGWHSIDNVDDCILAIKKVISNKEQIDNLDVLREFNMKYQAEKLLSKLLNNI